MRKYPVTSETGREYEVRVERIDDPWSKYNIKVDIYEYKKGLFGRNKRVRLFRMEFTDKLIGEKYNYDYIELVKYCVKVYEEDEHYPRVQFENWDGKC